MNQGVGWAKDGARLSHDTDPRINVTYTKDQRTLDSLRVSNDSIASELSFENLLPADSGNYSCISTNGSKVFIAKFVVIVTGKLVQRDIIL